MNREAARVFTPCYICADHDVLYDIRAQGGAPIGIATWLNLVVPA